MAAIVTTAKDLDGKEIDVLINNAGVYGPREYDLESVDYAEWMRVIQTNVFAPLQVCTAFIPHVARSAQKKMVTVSSKMGSIAENNSGGDYIYKTSKTMVNSAMRCFTGDVREKGIAVRVLHPGWVQTDMGGPNAAITPPQSASGIRNVINSLDLASTGQFYNYDGSELPW